MKEESKYYTPEIEEFHVGFEYQIWNDSWYEDENGKRLIEGTAWVNRTIGLGVWDLQSQVKRILEKDKVRVKHLDREDIESLGYKLMTPMVRDYDSYMTLSVTSLDVYINVPYIKGKPIFISSNIGMDKIIFCGTIKNKSELKRILKQIGV